MNALKSRVVLFGLLALASHSVFAADTQNFAGLTYGRSYDNFNNSHALNSNLNSPDTDGAIDGNNTWGLRLGQQNDAGRYYATLDQVSGSSDGIKLRQQDLTGSYDAFYPLSNSTKLFGGGTLGLTRVTQDGSSYSHNGDTGYLAGVQAGILQQVNDRTSLEAGYRYLRSNAKPDIDEDGTKLGSTQLDSTKEIYLGMNVYF
ncbi:membrane protein [Pseudomonas oryzihabitans]|uniref:hypothetical protein n=1 Tax=Pseudomonas rhizoryzae TaxID=2571129 RepID=UPI0007371821|nr:hypothetical protein [Pseudomonas rhizoryzae]APQ11568.1 hypothetical protein BJP27_08660 [Pseudomonas psychrotolerans]KTS74075.1 membrane protein [Pseudomonas psychrotolerans]KTS98397.1 membrane protein [Pseudomonas psychrotolerans]KTT22129.1 membrane protein [Pseudomonas psychrotolerans]KTT27484.1 membrane protein [Pseudomonas psychrotolerans]